MIRKLRQSYKEHNTERRSLKGSETDVKDRNDQDKQAKEKHPVRED